MATVSVKELDLLIALQAFLMELTGLPMDNVLDGQQNLTPMPTGDFIIMTPMATDSMSTNAVAYRFNPQSNVRRMRGLSRLFIVRITPVNGSAGVRQKKDWRC